VAGRTAPPSPQVRAIATHAARLAVGLLLLSASAGVAASPARGEGECAETARVITWNPGGWTKLVDAFAAHPAPCAEYYITIPPLVSDKTRPRAAAELLRLRGPQFHALADFHVSAWRANPETTSWYAKGVRFRELMAAAGYDVTRGETWAINELSMRVRWDPAEQAKMLALLAGLYNGPPGAQPAPGVVYVINQAHRTKNFWYRTRTQRHPYKRTLIAWTRQSAFWAAVDTYVAWWGQQTYTDCLIACVTGVPLPEKARRLNLFLQSQPRHAFAADAPSAAVAAARKVFDESYFPVLNAYWPHPAYGRTHLLTLERMRKLVRLQVYAARVWASTHRYPDLRIGLAWNENPGSTAAERLRLEPLARDLALTIALAIQGAYTPGSPPTFACSPTGDVRGCHPALPGARSNTAWTTFGRWKLAPLPLASHAP
jgi:hypothetical protein